LPTRRRYTEKRCCAVDVFLIVKRWFLLLYALVSTCYFEDVHVIAAVNCTIMSFQAVQKVRRNTSPLSNRQSGPVKATLSFTYPAVTLSCFSTPDTQRANNVKGTKKSSPERFHASSPSSRGLLTHKTNRLYNKIPHRRG